MNSIDLQCFMDGLNAKWQRERMAAQMTLGNLIQALEKLPPQTMVDGLNSPHSYRGYYCDLAFEPTETEIRADDLLAMCQYCMGRAFEGYKGGAFVMGEHTPVWRSHYGCTGDKIISLHDDGSFEVKSDDV